MNNTIKNVISNEIRDFLIKEDVVPESIKIEVHYEQSVAKLIIDREKLEGKKDFFSPDDVKAMTAEDVRDNYAAIMRSMKEWK